MIVIPVQSAAELLPEHGPGTSSSSSSRRRVPATSSPSSSRSQSLAPDETPYAVANPSFGRLSKDIARDFGRLYEAVAGARRIIVVCGAGISVSPPANIPDFRSSSGLFQKLKDQHPNAGLTSGKDLFDARLFNSEKTSDLFYTMIAELKELADRAQPTAFHHFLKRLDVEGRLLRVYTQNIDGLEERAGLTFGLKNAGPEGVGALRAGLGKRKRALGGGVEGPLAAAGTAAAKRTAWARSQSDSAVVFAQRAAAHRTSTLQDEDEDDMAAAQQRAAPMFPRTIPLHGSLNSMTCGRCSHQEILDNAFASAAESKTQHEALEDTDSKAKASAGPASGSEAPGAAQPNDKRPTIPELKRLNVHDVLASLRAGEPIPCPRCETADEVRLAAGLRSRGVGRMKPDVVLYGGQNDGAERVGECLQRDILGLRDPNETAVPETVAEIRHRERRARKEEEDRVQSRGGGAALGDEADLSFEVGRGGTCEDTLGAMFMADEDDAEEARLGEGKDALAPLLSDHVDPASSTSAPGSTRANKLARTTSASSSKSQSKTQSKPKPKPKLKPLPPDLLIVAGTSLKVSGTKRIIREFAKACHARDARWYPGADGDGEGEESSEDAVDSETATEGEGASSATVRRLLSQRRRKGQRKRSVSTDVEENDTGNADDDSQDEEGDEEDEDDEDEEEDDPKAPIRTILLNYDFPAPSSQWEDVFDIWIQGDVQAAARGLWPMPRDTAGSATTTMTGSTSTSASALLGALPISESDEERTAEGARLAGVSPWTSWALLREHLEELRAVERRKGRGKGQGKGKGRGKGRGLGTKSAPASKGEEDDDDDTMPPRLVALSLDKLAAVPPGAERAVPLSVLGRKRSFVKAKTTSSVVLGLPFGAPAAALSGSTSASAEAQTSSSRAVSTTTSSSARSREPSLLRDDDGSSSPMGRRGRGGGAAYASDTSSLTSLSESVRSSPGLTDGECGCEGPSSLTTMPSAAGGWGLEREREREKGRVLSSGRLEILITPPSMKGRKGVVVKGKKEADDEEMAVSLAGAGEASRAGTPTKASQASSSSSATSSPKKDKKQATTTTTKPASPSPSKKSAVSTTSPAKARKKGAKATGSGAPCKVAKAGLKASSVTGSTAIIKVKAGGRVKATKTTKSKEKVAGKEDKTVSPTKTPPAPAHTPAQGQTRQATLGFVPTAKPGRAVSAGVKVKVKKAGGATSGVLAGKGKKGTSG